MPFSKLVPPRQGPFLARPRLLRGVQDARLLLVCASPGYGKTALLSYAALSASVPCAWLRLDAADATPARLVAALVDAVRLAGVSAGEARLAEVEGIRSYPDPQAALDALVNHLVSYAGRLLVVLDDYQLIEASGAARSVVDYLLAYLPANTAVAIGTRVRPDLPSLARLFARGHAVEVTGADLRFTCRESTELLADCFGLNLEDADLEVLDGRLEGWAVGLQAWRQEAMAHDGRLALVPARPSRALRVIGAYCQAEILGPQPPEVQRFLVESAALDELDGETCNAVLGRHDSGLMLQHLQRHNLLVSREDSGGLRYQRLFLEYLREQLAHDARRSGQLARAAATYFAACAVTELAKGQPLAADVYLWRAQAACSRAGDDGRLQLEFFNAPGFHVPFRRGRFQAALEAADQAHALAIRLERPDERCVALVQGGDALVRLGRLAEAREWAESALALAGQLGLPLHQVEALRLQGACQVADPRVAPEVAREPLLEALERLSAIGQRALPGEIRVRLELSSLEYRAGRPDEAGRHARRALECLRLAGPECALLQPTAWLALATAVTDEDGQLAEQLVLRARSAAEGWGDAFHLVSAEYRLAVLARARRLPDSLRHLQAVLDQVTRPGFERVVLDEPTHSAPLLADALAQGIRPDLVGDLLVKLGPQAVDPLIGALEAPDPALRIRAAELLGRIGDARARRPLQRLLKDGAASVRAPARAALDALTMPDPPFLRIHLLGHFRVSRGDTPISEREWKTRKVRTLFKYLLVNKGRFIPQERLMDLLWPEAELRSASMNLRTAVALLRRALEPLLEGSASRIILTIQGEGIAFNAETPHWVDVEVFLRHYEAGRSYEARGLLDEAAAEYEAADALYGGDFLEEDIYEDWTLGDRERYRELHLGILARLIDLTARRGDLARAIALAQRILATDDCREDIHMRLMQLLWKAGRPAQAVRQFAICAEILERELDTRPGPEMKRLLAEIERELAAGTHRFTPSSRPRA